MSNSNQISKDVAEFFEHELESKVILAELRKRQNVETVRERYLRVVAEHLEALEPPEIEVDPPNFGKPAHTWVVILSDWHVGQRTTSAETGGLFEQSTEITTGQIRDLCSKLASMHKTWSASVNIVEIVLLVLGDLVEGDDMRPSQHQGIDRLVIQQTLEAGNLLYAVTQQAMKLAPKVRVRIVGGNHDRTSRKPGYGGLGELGYLDTFAHLIGVTLEQRLSHAVKHNRVDIRNSESFFDGEIVCGQRICFEHGACLSEDSEMLTAVGWKHNSDLADGELVACWDDKTGLLSWKPLIGVSRYNYDGDMVKVKQRGVDMLMTPNHRVYIRPQMYPPKFTKGKVILASELQRTMPLPFSAKWEIYGTFGTYDDGKRLGLFLSEGWVNIGRNRTSQYMLAQSERVNPAVCKEMERVFSDCNIYNYIKTSGYTKKGEDILQIHIPVSKRDFFDKWSPLKIPNMSLLTEWSQNALTGLFDGLLAGDGDSRSQSVFTQNEGQIANLFSALCVRLGYRVSGQNHGQPGVTRTKVYGLTGGGGHGKPSSITQWTARLRHDPEIIKYSGIVWCPETPTGTFVARRNGCAFITGNSFRTSSSSYGGVGYYPIANAARKYKEMLDGADLVIMGHFHQANLLNMGRGYQVLNGALPASTQYVQSNFKSVARPTQVLLDLDDKHGLVGFHPIYLEHAGLAKPGDYWKSRG